MPLFLITIWNLLWRYKIYVGILLAAVILILIGRSCANREDMPRIDENQQQNVHERIENRETNRLEEQTNRTTNVLSNVDERNRQANANTRNAAPTDYEGLSEAEIANRTRERLRKQ